MKLRILTFKALQIHLEAQLEEVLGDLSYMEYLILQAIVRSNNHVTPSNLASAVQTSGANITWYLDRLTERNYLTRDKHTTDRRSYIVTLNDARSTAMKVSRIEEQEEILFEKFFKPEEVGVMKIAISRVLSSG